MSAGSTLRYRVSRTLGRFTTRTAAILTLERMPPFVGASAIVRDGDNLLAVIDPIRREPILPGGHLTWREKPEDAVIREVREETGLQIQPERLEVVLAGSEWTGEAGIVRVVYSARLIGGTLTSSGEGEAVWIPLIEATTVMRRDGRIVRGWLAGWADEPVIAGR